MKRVVHSDTLFLLDESAKLPYIINRTLLRKKEKEPGFFAELCSFSNKGYPGDKAEYRHRFMIRHFAAVFKPHSKNYSEIELFHHGIESFRPQEALCASCGARGRFSFHDSYKRDLITYDEQVHIHKISIPRYLCASCGHPHAVIPDMLIPYGSYSLRFVLAAVKAYFSRAVSGATVALICDKFQIAISTLYAWKKRFLSHKSLWLGAMANLASTEVRFLTEFLPCPNLLADFFDCFGFSFLQNHLASASAVP